MGDVYYAEDSQLHRGVALKRVKRDFGPEGRRHILKEAQRACALSSEYIARVYDVLEESEELFLVMEYVEGTTLRRQLLSGAGMELERFFPVACQCAQALTEAHHKGVLHHDLKPENIMLTPAGRVKVLDFGLAVRMPVGDSATPTISTQFQSRICAGTPGYMSPEVLLDEGLDARSDLFSLGVVFYEMLTGRRPFEDSKAMLTAERTLHGDAPAMVELGPAAKELEPIVFKLLAKNRGARYATAGELLGDLEMAQEKVRRSSWAWPKSVVVWTRRQGRKRWLRAGIGTLVVVLALGSLPGLWPQKTVLPEKKHLVVLPFTPAKEDAESRAFCRGLTETLSSKLTRLTDKYPLQVVPASEARLLTTASVEEARTRLGVNLVLEGSFHQLGQKTRVNYNLVDARTRRVLRAATIAADADNPFELEDRVVASALGSLDLELGTQERRNLAVHGTTQPEAYDSYLRGRGYLQDYEKAENVESAIQVFRRALDSDPNFGLAYAGLGESYWQKYELTHDRFWISLATDACQRAAIEGGGSNCLGMVLNGTGKYELAEAEFQRSLQSDVTNDEAYRGLAFAYEHRNKMAEAEQIYRRAIEVRHGYWASYNWLGTFLYRQSRYAEAVEMFRQAATLAPDNARLHSNLGGVYLALGRYGEAIEALESSVRIHPSQDAYANLGAAYLYLRRFAEASQACEEAVKLDEGEYSVWGNLGDAYYWEPGRRDQSKAAYRKAIALAEERLHVNPQDGNLLSFLAVFHAMLQEKPAATAGMSKALALAPADVEVRFNAAIIASQFGNREETLSWLRKALDSGLPISRVRDSPNFDYLHSHPQFQQLLREKLPA
jgi:eukaryotic-like serine/threonine-protein kinase